MKIALICAMLSLSVAVAMASQVPDIWFSQVESSGGGWYYEGIDVSAGIFSFHQQIAIDAVLGFTTDPLCSQFMFLPDLTLSAYTPGPLPGMGIGTVSADGPVEIKDSLGNVLLSGILADGTYMGYFANSSFYSDVTADITVTAVDHSFESAYLSGISVGDLFDLNLSLDAVKSFDTIIRVDKQGSNGFSGSMTTFVPEPMTLALLGLGGLLLRSKK